MENESINESRKAAKRLMWIASFACSGVALVISLVVSIAVIMPAASLPSGAGHNAFAFFVLACVWTFASMLSHHYGGTLTSIVGSSFFLFWMFRFRALFPLVISGTFNTKGWLEYGAVGSYIWMLAGLLFCSPSWFKNFFMTDDEFSADDELARELSAILANSAIGFVLSIGFLRGTVPSAVYFFAAVILSSLATIPCYSRWLKFLQLAGYVPAMFLGTKGGTFGAIYAVVVCGVIMLWQSLRKHREWDDMFGDGGYGYEYYDDNGGNDGYGENFGGYYSDADTWRDRANRGDFDNLGGTSGRDWENFGKKASSGGQTGRASANRDSGNRGRTSDPGRRQANAGRVPPDVRAAMDLFGIRKPEDVNPVALKKKWRSLLKTNHPDAGGDPERARQINEAYDLLRKTFGIRK